NPRTGAKPNSKKKVLCGSSQLKKANKPTANTDQFTYQQLPAQNTTSKNGAFAPTVQVHKRGGQPELTPTTQGQDATPPYDPCGPAIDGEPEDDDERLENCVEALTAGGDGVTTTYQLPPPRGRWC
ncbi:hypothetical protein A2U01_0036954, partial [Trifolium medium]|nr:hypothetical protein [Trifolium medium]